jgi:hypothetical protein
LSGKKVIGVQKFTKISTEQIKLKKTFKSMTNSFGRMRENPVKKYTQNLHE